MNQKQKVLEGGLKTLTDLKALVEDAIKSYPKESWSELASLEFFETLTKDLSDKAVSLLTLSAQGQVALMSRNLNRGIWVSQDVLTNYLKHKGFSEEQTTTQKQDHTKTVRTSRQQAPLRAASPWGRLGRRDTIAPSPVPEIVQSATQEEIAPKRALFKIASLVECGQLSGDVDCGSTHEIAKYLMTIVDNEVAKELLKGFFDKEFSERGTIIAHDHNKWQAHLVWKLGHITVTFTDTNDVPESVLFLSVDHRALINTYDRLTREDRDSVAAKASLIVQGELVEVLVNAVPGEIDEAAADVICQAIWQRLVMYVGLLTR